MLVLATTRTRTQVFTYLNVIQVIPRVCLNTAETRIQSIQNLSCTSPAVCYMGYCSEFSFEETVLTKTLFAFSLFSRDGFEGIPSKTKISPKGTKG